MTWDATGTRRNTARGGKGIARMGLPSSSLSATTLRTLHLRWAVAACYVFSGAYIWCQAVVDLGAVPCQRHPRQWSKRRLHRSRFKSPGVDLRISILRWPDWLDTLGRGSCHVWS